MVAANTRRRPPKTHPVGCLVSGARSSEIGMNHFMSHGPVQVRGRLDQTRAYPDNGFPLRRQFMVAPDKFVRDNVERHFVRRRQLFLAVPRAKGRSRQQKSVHGFAHFGGNVETHGP